MPAPKPVIESILDDVTATLATVTRANGYHIDLKPERRRLDGNAMGNGTAVVTLGTATPQEGPHQYTDWQQVINVTVAVTLTDALPYGLDTQLWIVGADIIKALCGSPTNQANPRRDGWAIDTTPGEVLVLTDEGTAVSNQGTVQASVNVLFRHAWGDPFTSPHRS